MPPAQQPSHLWTAIPQLYDFLLRAAEHWPDSTAVKTPERTVTFGAIAREAGALSRYLASAGVDRGDRVVIFTDNSVETCAAFWGAQMANAVPSIVNPTTKAGKLSYVLNNCGAVALVADTRLGHVWHAALDTTPAVRTVVVTGDEAHPSDPPRTLVSWRDAIAAGDAAPDVPRRNLDIDLAAIIYTSGSTGEPKGIMLTHRNMIAAAESISAYLGLRHDDVILSVLPMSFDYGLYQAIMAACVGAAVVLEKSFAFPAATLRALVSDRATVFPLVPSMAATLAGMTSLGGYDRSTVRLVTNTAAALSRGQIGFLRGVFPNARVFSMYGLTECKRCTYLPPEDLDRKPDSVGIAIPNTELWLVDDRDRRLGPGEVGQLVIRGATVMRGYWGDPGATAKRLRPGPLPGEMVLYTGDYCRLDEDGYLYFVGRMDDIIKSRGEKVSPKEVENALVDIDGVREAAVIGVPDEVLGQAIKAFVVAAPGHTLSPQGLKVECQRRLESHLVPRDIVLVDSLPKTTTGKISKQTLS